MISRIADDRSFIAVEKTIEIEIDPKSLSGAIGHDGKRHGLTRESDVEQLRPRAGFADPIGLKRIATLQKKAALNAVDVRFGNQVGMTAVVGNIDQLG